MLKYKTEIIIIAHKNYLLFHKHKKKIFLLKKFNNQISNMTTVDGINKS